MEYWKLTGSSNAKVRWSLKLLYFKIEGAVGALPLVGTG